MKQDILSLENKNVGTIELNESIFGLEVRADILQRVVRWQLARMQAGTHSGQAVQAERQRQRPSGFPQGHPVQKGWNCVWSGCP